MFAQEPIWAPSLVKSLEGKEVTLIRPGQHHTLFLTKSGTVLSVGRPTYGRLGRREEGLDSASDDAKPHPGEVALDNGGEFTGLAAGAVWTPPCAGMCPLTLPAHMCWHDAHRAGANQCQMYDFLLHGLISSGLFQCKRMLQFGLCSKKT